MYVCGCGRGRGREYARAQYMVVQRQESPARPIVSSNLYQLFFTIRQAYQGNQSNAYVLQSPW